MDPTAVRRALAGFDPRVAIEDAWTPPSSWYTSPAIDALERSAVFGRAWLPLARVDQVPEPGDYASGCLAGEPWVVVRDQSGTVCAFHNVCRHKGREVVQGAGRATELVCGYHAWRYGLDGRLRSAPRLAGIRGFDRQAMGLQPMRTETWGPWVFANADPGAAPLRARLGELDARLQATGWTALRFHTRKSWILECNWKVVADNYLDGGYHIPHMHPTLDAQLDMASYRTELFDAYSIQSSGVAAAPDDRIGYAAARRIGGGSLYAWIYPSFMINRYGPCMDSNLVVPLGPERCEVIYDFFFEESAGDEARRFIAESIVQSDVTQREDIAICESVQVGLRSRSYVAGRYAPEVEIGEHHFHRLLHRDLVDAVDGGDLD